jgi:hypothetical protein
MEGTAVDDDRFDALLDASVPAVTRRDMALLATVHGLVDETWRPAPRRRGVRRTVAAGLVAVSVLGIGGVAAAGGWLPLAWSPWSEQGFDSGQRCNLRFMATEQLEPALAVGIGRVEQREAVVAAQAFLDTFDPDTIDEQEALARLLAEQARNNATLASSEIAPETPEELEVHAMVLATYARLSAALHQQGINPAAVSIITTTDCQALA